MIFNLDDLTIGQAKEITALLGNSAKIESNQQSSIYTKYIGKYVICRSCNEGVNAGVVIAIDETGVVLDEARRLYYHKPLNKNMSWYEGVALSGLDSDSKVGAKVEKVIAENYSLTVCSDSAKESIQKAKDHEQS